MANEFPADWKAYKLDELGFVGRGKSKHRPRNDPILYEGMYPFVQTGDVKAANFYLKDFSQTYNENGLKQSKLWGKGTLCITIAANIAETAILDIEACFPDSIIGFVPDKSKTTSAYIKYYIDYIKLQMQQISQGTTQDNLSAEKLLSFNFIVPDITEQQKIISILTAYDNLIENNNHRIAILEEMARSLYREWFVKFRFPGHEKVKMVDSELGQIPEGWEIVKYTDITNVMSGGTPKTDNEDFWNGGIPFFTPKDAGSNIFCIETIKELSEQGLKKCNSKLYPRDTVFITARGTVGKVVLAGRKMAMNQSCYALQGKVDVGQMFLYQLTLERVNHLKKNATGATFDAIVVDTFERMKVIKPPFLLTEHFETKVKSIFDLILNLSIRNQNLKTQRDMLLPKLISGKIEV